MNTTVRGATVTLVSYLYQVISRVPVVCGLTLLFPISILEAQSEVQYEYRYTSEAVFTITWHDSGRSRDVTHGTLDPNLVQSSNLGYQLSMPGRTLQNGWVRLEEDEVEYRFQGVQVVVERDNVTETYSFKPNTCMDLLEAMAAFVASGEEKSTTDYIMSSYEGFRTQEFVLIREGVEEIEVLAGAYEAVRVKLRLPHPLSLFYTERFWYTNESDPVLLRGRSRDGAYELAAIK